VPLILAALWLLLPALATASWLAPASTPGICADADAEGGAGHVSSHGGAGNSPSAPELIAPSRRRSVISSNRPGVTCCAGRCLRDRSPPVC